MPSADVLKTAMKSIEFVMELYNERQCGVVFVANNYFQDQMEDGENSEVLKRMRRRRIWARTLKNTTTREDLNTFAKAYGLPPSAEITRDLETRIIQEEEIGMWLVLLQQAAALASERKQKMKWDHVHLACAAFYEIEKNPARKARN